jgi:hypothetical protein
VLQTKGIENIFNKIIEKLQISGKRWLSRYRRLLEHQKDKTRKELHIVL